MMSINFSDIAILNIRGSDYHCIISLISENEATNLMKKGWFDWKKDNIIKHKKFFLYLKMSKEIFTFSSIEIEKKVLPL